MNTLDADGHVWETETMFEGLDPDFYPQRPFMVSFPLDTAAGDSNRAWIVENKVTPRFSNRGATFPAVFPGSPGAASRTATYGDQTLEDVDARLKGMDTFELDKQVVYPTMFLESIVDDVRLETALYRAYNDYLAAASAKSKGRLTWAALVPWRDPDAAVAEVKRVSKLGAAGIFTMGVIYDHHLDDPLFYPIYEAASEEDLPICVHLGWGSPAATQIFSKNAFFCSATVPVIWGFYFVMSSGLLGRFPKLRMGFIESGSQWMPYLINQIRRFYEPPTVIRGEGTARVRRVGGIDRNYYKDPLEWFKEGRVFVTFEADEDLPHLLKHLGEGALMMSTDYPHGDLSADEKFVTKIRANEELSPSLKEKLLGVNASRFYRV